MTNLLIKLFVKDYKNTSNGGVREKYGSLSSFVGIAVNIILALVKLLLGLLTASVAIMADALNNLSDAGSSLITLISFKLSAKPADRDHPFGHARIEYIASMIVAFLILIVGFEMLTNSLGSLFGFKDSDLPEFSITSIIILGSTICLKLWLAFFYRKIAKKIDSGVIKASSADSLFDCISTFAVLISALIIKFGGYPKIDAIVGIGVSALIFIAGIRILIETKNSILGEAPTEEIIQGIKNIVSEYPEVLGTHDLMLHNYGPKVFVSSFHVEVDGSHDIYMLHDMVDNLERRIKEEMNILCTIHMDPIVTNDEVVSELYQFVLNTVKNDVDDRITIHDFRTVVGATHTNLIFDIVLPYESTDSVEDITNKISTAINNKREYCYCVITVDRG